MRALTVRRFRSRWACWWSRRTRQLLGHARRPARLCARRTISGETEGRAPQQYRPSTISGVPRSSPAHPHRRTSPRTTASVSTDLRGRLDLAGVRLRTRTAALPRSILPWHRPASQRETAVRCGYQGERHVVGSHSGRSCHQTGTNRGLGRKQGRLGLWAPLPAGPTSRRPCSGHKPVSLGAKESVVRMHSPRPTKRLDSGRPFSCHRPLLGRLHRTMMPYHELLGPQG